MRRNICKKKVLKKNMKLHMENCLFPETSMHQPLNSVCGYATDNKYLFQGLQSTFVRPKLYFQYNDCLHDKGSFKWYDSYYYYKKNYKNRHIIDRQPLIPLDTRLDYRDALISSFSDEKTSKCSFTVLQNGFCPSVWMEKLDVGFYTAWMLYTIGDHKRIFENADYIRTSDLSNINLLVFGDEIKKIKFCDMSAIDDALQKSVDAMCGKKITIEKEKKKE